MANEKNVTAVATDSKAATEAVQNLILEREMFIGKDGKEYWSYLVRGKVRGRDTKVDFSASDQGGYEVLDLIFDIKPTAELVMHDEEMTDDNGKATKYTVYEAQNTDENGEAYSYKIKPARNSDKSLLSFLLKEQNKKAGGGKTA